MSVYITKHGFTASAADPCLFHNKNGVILVLYVDDMIITGGTPTHIQEAVDLLKKKYESRIWVLWTTVWALLSPGT